MLIGTVAKELEMDAEICTLYGDFLQIAEYYVIKHSIGPLRSKLDRQFNDDTLDVTRSRPHMLLPDLAAPAIYTTNWDSLIERAFAAKGKGVNLIVTLKDLLAADPKLPNIVKYHGDFTNDDSLVFTESSYFARLDLESPLDIRLRADILGRIVLFIGYSFSDLNVRYLWFKLSKILKQANPDDAHPNAYIVMTKPNEILEQVYRRRGIQILSLDPLDPSKSLVSMLEEMVGAATV